MSSAFTRLRELLGTVDAPSGAEQVRLDLGELRLVDPADVHGFSAALAEGWACYPRLGGSASLTEAYGRYLTATFDVDRGRDSSFATEPTPGSKAAVSALLTLAIHGPHRHRSPSVVLPDPGYPAYAAAAATLDARLSFYPTDGDVPSAIEDALAGSMDAVAAIVVVNPGIPRGLTLSKDDLRRIQRLARRAGARLIVDECYVDLHVGDRSGAGCVEALDDFTGTVVLHTLSKRSCAPGLRSGFICGDSDLVAEFAQWNRSCGVSPSNGVDAAATVLWADDDHVDRARNQLAQNWTVADETFSAVPGYVRSVSGPFVWLPVADDCVAAARLWSMAGVRVMPGSFLSALPLGSPHLRLAIGGTGHRLRRALEAVAQILTTEALTIGVPT